MPAMNSARRRSAAMAIAACAALGLAGNAAASGSWSSGQAANVVLGEPNFTTGSGNNMSASNMNGVDGVAVDPTTGKLFVSDNGNRILRFSSAAAAQNGAAAEALFGQNNFTTGGSNAGNGAVASAFSLRTSQQMVVDPAGRLWVADRDNHRVLRFDNASTKASEANADGVLGQADFVANLANRGGTVAANTLNGPVGVWIDGLGVLWVGDESNHRVLAYALPALKANGANADLVLGQADFVHNAYSNTASTMRNPRGVVVDASGTLYVADSLNSRVLRFANAVAKANGAAADGVLGHQGTTQSGMVGPIGVTVDGAGRLYVGDGQNNRVLIFENAAAKADLANADFVLGQANFTTGTQNTGGITASTMFAPGQVFYDKTTNSLWVADYANWRALRFFGPGGPTTLDVDVSQSATKYDALTDGLLILRHLFGLTGTSLSSGALGGTATRTDPVAIKNYLAGISSQLDVDGNGHADALTDGLLIVRYLFGLRGAALTAGAYDPSGSRTSAAAIESYIQSLMP